MTESAPVCERCYWYTRTAPHCQPQGRFLWEDMCSRYDIDKSLGQLVRNEPNHIAGIPCVAARASKELCGPTGKGFISGFDAEEAIKAATASD